MLSSAPYQTGQLRRPATRIPTVCVVDPKADDYRGWNSLAQNNGLRLKFVATAEEGLRVSRTDAIDLWVINADLPGLSGCELCAMLKGRLPAVPVYVVAENYSTAVEQAARQARATLFGVKPEHETWLESWAEQHAMGPPTGRAIHRGD